MMTTKRPLLGGARKPVRIACINHAKRSLDVPMGQLTAALQKCYDKHFLPVWGYPVKLYNTDDPKPTDWQLIYVNSPSQKKGLLGRHELTYRGQPISKVFVETVLAAGEDVSVAASHELFEMVLDPMANLWADKNKRTQYAYEVCDAVEEESFKVDGLPMSNFLHPSWFEPFDHPRGTKFDHLGSLTEPFTMTEGGYLIKRVDGRDIVKEFGSLAKKRRFEAEDRTGHRSEFRDPRGVHLAPRGRKR